MILTQQNIYALANFLQSYPDEIKFLTIGLHDPDDATVLGLQLNTMLGPDLEVRIAESKEALLIWPKLSK